MISLPPFLVAISPGAVRGFASVSPIMVKILQCYTGLCTDVPLRGKDFSRAIENFPGIVGCHRYRLRNFPVIVRMFGDGPAVLEKSLPVVSGGP